MIPKEFFDISTGFRFSKLHFGSVPSIPVAVLELILKCVLELLATFHQQDKYPGKKFCILKIDIVPVIEIHKI